MKYLFLFLLFPFLFHTNEKVEWLTPIIHDFGDIIEKEPVEFKFEFKNASEEPMLIDNVRTTCGCTTPDWSWDPIEPDSTSFIRVVYDAKKQGFFNKKVKVFFSNQRKPTVLKIEGYVEKLN